MHYRSSSEITGTVPNSTMRRRSGGYKHLVKDDSFSQASPSVSVERAAEVTLSAATRPNEASIGYHVYSSIATSDEASEDEAGCANSSNMTLSVDNPVVPSSSRPSSEATRLIDDGSNLIEVVDLGSHSSDCQPLERLASTISIDFVHGGIIQAIGATDRFTHKWPTPKTVKYFEAESKVISDMSYITPSDSAVPALEEGHGLRLRPGHVGVWTTSKWCLLFSVTIIFVIGSTTLIAALMTWSNAWKNSSVMVVADNDILILITLAGSIFLFTSFIGIAGTLLNSRPILAIYALLLWPAFLSLPAVGYTSYRRSSLNLDGKLNFSWSRYYTPLGKRIIQDSLGCCGYYSSMHEASPSKDCYLRTPLPGCKAELLVFERTNLRNIWTAAFSLATIHLANIFITLLCANHITATFGNGFTPKQYRLGPTDVKAEADNIINGIGAIMKPSVRLASEKFAQESLVSQRTSYRMGGLTA